jgi:glycosyltransferase involved in cell wall biosynthesis
MRILILTFYYRPDLSAGSFRTTALVNALRECAPPDTQIDVVTTLPNRYRTFSSDAAEVESAPGVEVRRIRLPSHRSDMLGQAYAFLQFARRARSIVAVRPYDLVFATSSRLMTAALGACIARNKRARLYLDIRDIFVDTITDLLPRPLAFAVDRVFARVESRTMRRADRINLVSPGFADYFRARYPDRALAWFTNGIDDEFVTAARSLPPKDRAAQPATVLYAGNIGEGQALHRVLPGLANALRERARFVVIGDGGRRALLETALTAAGVTNVELRAPVSRDALLQAYRSADVLFLHLGAQAAFEKVLPSKLFEYAALGKPILAGVAGYAARFAMAEIANAAVFAPCDVAAGVEAYGRLELVDRARPEFIARYARAHIARAMAADVLTVAGEARA